MGLITAANARELAAKALIARRANRERRLNLDQRLAAIEQRIVELTVQAPVAPEALTGYVAERLTRVRAQLDLIDRQMLTERDPQKLDRLAAAQAKVAEQERVLAGRPLPGSRRPKPERERPRGPRTDGPLGLA